MPTTKEAPRSDLTALLHRWLAPASRAAERAGFSPQQYRGVTMTLTFSWSEGDVVVDPGTGAIIVRPF